MSRPLRTIAVALLLLVVSGCSSASLPETLRQGRTIYGDYCSKCHGSRGQGGVGPSLATVTETWPSCDDQVEWIGIGSEAWRSRYGPTYGATDKPITDVMPAHSDRLSPEEIRMVAAFERSAYGGVDNETALAECRVGS